MLTENSQTIKRSNKSLSISSAWAVAGALLLLMFLSRIPFQSQILYHWDSVNFAYAIQEFNLEKEQPHPPGYIGYVWLSQAVDSVLHNAQQTLVAISLVSGALAVVALWYLGRAMYNSRVALIAALLLASSPLFWFYGEIALPHTLDTFLVISGVWCLYETMRGNHKFLYPGIVVLAVAGGVRPQTLVFLGPLILFALRGIGWKKFLISLGVGAMVCLLWFIPLMNASGGLSNYLRLTGEFGSRFQDTTSVFLGAGWPGVKRNVLKLGLYTAYAWSVAVIPVIIYAVIKLIRRDWNINWERAIFLALWMLPSLVFYILIHMGQQGLVFIFLPALLLLSAFSVTELLSSKPVALMVAAGLMVAINTAIFIALPEYPLGQNGPRLLTRQTLVNTDHYYGDRFEAIRENFPADSTLVMATDWHHLNYYLPDYHIYPINISGDKWIQIEDESLQGQSVVNAVDWGVSANSEGAMTVIAFDVPVESSAAETILLSNGDNLLYFEWPVTQPLRVEQTTVIAQ